MKPYDHKAEIISRHPSLTVPIVDLISIAHFLDMYHGNGNSKSGWNLLSLQPYCVVCCFGRRT